jgi:hypothetical protein
MSIWTTKNGNAHQLNIDLALINCMQEKGARFCTFADNLGIDDKTSDYYEDAKNDNVVNRKFKDIITVTCEDGESVTGYVIHMVKGPCAGSNEKNWFIIQPGTYPTKYILKQHHFENNVNIDSDDTDVTIDGDVAITDL